MGYTPKHNGPPEPTSPKNIASEIITTIILLAGTWVIEKLKTFFESTLPFAITVILSICELTLIIFFLAGTIRALRIAFKELDEFIILVKDSATFRSSRRFLNLIFQQFKSINPKTIPWKTIFKQLGIAFIISIITFVILLLFVNIKIVTAFLISNVLPRLKDITGLFSLTSTAIAVLLRSQLSGKHKSDD